ncbi:MAG TPA: L-histidine N(alpha)-methyltransferase [Candidatus Binatus sp.]|jgi:L-histidine N-alpha-methyltransferase|nr:L-histidine N(alpha)-methyltransferase [Candidatus Binatus sp.]
MGTAPRMTSASAQPQVAPDFAAEVVVGLNQPGQKELPSKYLYDEVGSALFDVICLLPEYGLSRAGMRLLQRHSHEIVSLLPSPVIVAELGSGSGQKTRLLLEALSRRQRVNYYPIDISGSALSRCRQEIGQIDNVSIVGFERAYLDGLQEVSARRREGERILVLFLGSTIGNFDRPAGDQFLREVRAILQEGDALLLATDLEKPVSQLLLAYDDPAGVTAAFNMNLLARINRDLGADFDLKQFRHLARYDESERRVEMHLVSKAWQRITIREAGFRFYLRAGETIWTESSHKYNPDEVIQMGSRTGFRCVQQWCDAEWPFAQNLFFAV